MKWVNKSKNRLSIIEHMIEHMVEDQVLEYAQAKQQPSSKAIL